MCPKMRGKGNRRDALLHVVIVGFKRTRANPTCAQPLREEAQGESMTEHGRVHDHVVPCKTLDHLSVAQDRNLEAVCNQGRHTGETVKCRMRGGPGYQGRRWGMP